MKINTTTAIVILLVAFAVLTGIKATVDKVDATQIPQELQIVWRGIVYVFTTSAIAPLFAFVRNIYGYLENKYETDPAKRSQMNYEASQLWGTWLRYEGYIKAISIAAIALTEGTQLAPYAVYLAGALAFVVDLIRKSISDLKGKE